MSAVRQALEDAINGDRDVMTESATGRATLRALRVIASAQDTANETAQRQSRNLQAIAASVSAGLILAAMTAALRLT